MLRKIILSIIITFGIHVADAQNVKKFNKLLEKAEKSYESGKYSKALKHTRKVVKKSTKTLGPENNFIAMAYLREAKYNMASGKVMDFDSLIVKGLRTSENVNSIFPLNHALALLDATEILMDYGHYRWAEETLNQAIPVFKEQQIYDGKYEADVELKLVEIYMHQGLYNKSLALLNKYESFYIKRTAKQETVFDEKKNENVKVTVDKHELKKRKEDLAQLITLKSNILRHKGEIIRSDSAFVYGDEWIKKNVGKKTQAYAEHMHYFALMLEENGTKKLPVKLHDTALSSAKSSYGKTHPRTIDMYESLIKGLILDGSVKQALSVFNDYENIIKKNFGTKSSYYASMAAVSFWSNIQADEIKKVESQANKLLNNMKVIPTNHPRRIELNNMLAHVAALERKYQKTFDYLDENLKITENLYGNQTGTYGLLQIRYANAIIDYGDDFNKAKQIYEDWYYGMIADEIGSSHIYYADIATHMAGLYEALDDYQKANDMLEEALLSVRVKYDNKDVDYGKNLDKIARLQINIGQYDEAEKNLNTALEILSNFSDSKNIIHYIKALETQARIFAIKGMYDEAEDNIKSAQKLLARKAERSSEYDQTEAQENLAWVYLMLGKYGVSDNILQKSIKEKEYNFNASSSRLINPLVDYGRLQLIRGDYTATDQIARRALNISNNIYGDNSTKNANALQLLGELYTNIGDYQKAKEYFTTALVIQEAKFGREHFNVAILLSQLALSMFYEDDGTNLKEIENLLTESRDIVGRRFGTLNPIYADILKNIAKVKIANNQFEDAYAFLDQSESIWKAKAGKRNNINAAEIHILRGDINYMKRNFDEAESEYRKGRRLYQKFFNNKHPEYVRTVSKLAKVNYMQGDYKKAKSDIEEALSNYNDFINNYFPALSEREKTKYWNTIKNDYDFYNTLAVTHGSVYPDIVENMYNNALKTKSLLLSSSVKVRERIMNSDDDELKLKYLTWINKKETLSAAIAMSAEQLKEEGLDPNSLAREVELLEKELSQGSEIFKSNFENREIKWEQVKASLKENEVAVEMIRFRYFDHVLTDSILYAVLTLKNGKKDKPELLIISNGKDLDSKYFNYYKNAIKYRLADRYSYEKFWKPIESKVGSSATIYLSADGVYNQINLEAIPLGKDKYVLDQSNIVLVSNTKDLYINNVTTRIVQEENTALLFGNPKFYVASTENYVSYFRSGGSKISDLPGTAVEVDELTQLLTSNGWTIKDYLREAASENQVKQINSPKVFHIATHGFFTPEDQFQKDAGILNMKEGSAMANPLLRTGLMLTGAGDLLVQTKYNFNQEDGILTAFEAMNLNLDKTDLVVLSACETGVGEIQAGEGVYGLQRSFMVAGARSLIMSLFKVSDEATQKLMVAFYKNWLETGDKRKAFVDAKKEIRNEFKDPLYWGAFIMIGLD